MSTDQSKSGARYIKARFTVWAYPKDPITVRVGASDMDADNIAFQLVERAFIELQRKAHGRFSDWNNYRRASLRLTSLWDERNVSGLETCTSMIILPD